MKYKDRFTNARDLINKSTRDVKYNTQRTLLALFCYQVYIIYRNNDNDENENEG